jgi:hypothetical protein
MLLNTLNEMPLGKAEESNGLVRRRCACAEVATVISVAIVVNNNIKRVIYFMWYTLF